MISLREEPMAPFFTKWHVEGLPVPAVFHRFTAPDGGAPHDHPWPFRSYILSGGYVEDVYSLTDPRIVMRRHRRPGDVFEVGADHIHRIVEMPEGECWTLIMPLGPKVKEPGFYEFRDGDVWHRPWHRPEFERVTGRELADGR